MENTESTSKWKIGNVVALNSHFYEADNESNIVIITGEPKLISPIMVIVETVVEKPVYEEHTGMILSEKNDFQCRCMWFSHKNYQFEEAWISSRLLKTITIYNKKISVEEHIKKHGALVEFKTAAIELGKKKSSLKQIAESSTHTLTSELNFMSPVMQVIGTAKSESKEPLFDPKTLKKKREISKSLVKCKFYNPNSDKLSEALIPIEALETVSQVNNDTLNDIKEAIIKNEYLSIIRKDKNNKETSSLVQPKRINYRAGRYYLDCIDYMLGGSEKDISEITLTKAHKNYFSDELPKFEFNAKKLSIIPISTDNITKLIASAGAEKYIWLEYEDDKGNKTKRTITDYEVIESDEKDSNGKNHNYLRANCLLRKDQRFFRIDRIKAIRILNHDK